MTHVSMIADINRRLDYVESQVALNADRDVVMKEQCQAMLASFSTTKQVTLDTVTRVSHHLADCGKFEAEQLASFSACLRLASTKAADKGTARPMQNNEFSEYYLTQADWDDILAVNTSAKHMTDIIGARLHSWGVSCADSDTLKRGSAIVQHCIGGDPAASQKRQWAKDIQTKIKKSDKIRKWPYEHLAVYPRSSAELPAHYADYACGPGIKPVPPPAKLVDEITALVSETPYKNTHSDIAKNRTQQDSASQAPPPVQLQVPGQQVNMMDMMGMFGQMFFGSGASGSQGGSQGPFRKFHSRLQDSRSSPSPSPPKQLSLKDTPFAKQHTKSVEDDSDDEGNCDNDTSDKHRDAVCDSSDDLDDFESKMAATKLAVKNDKKKAAVAEKNEKKKAAEAEKNEKKKAAEVEKNEKKKAAEAEKELRAKEAEADAEIHKKPACALKRPAAGDHCGEHVAKKAAIGPDPVVRTWVDKLAKEHVVKENMKTDKGAKRDERTYKSLIYKKIKTATQDEGLTTSQQTELLHAMYARVHEAYERWAS